MVTKACTEEEAVKAGTCEAFDPRCGQWRPVRWKDGWAEYTDTGATVPEFFGREWRVTVPGPEPEYEDWPLDWKRTDLAAKDPQSGNACCSYYIDRLGLLGFVGPDGLLHSDRIWWTHGPEVSSYQKAACWTLVRATHVRLAARKRS